MELCEYEKLMETLCVKLCQKSHVCSFLCISNWPHSFSDFFYPYCFFKWKCINNIKCRPIFNIARILSLSLCFDMHLIYYLFGRDFMFHTVSSTFMLCSYVIKIL